MISFQKPRWHTQRQMRLEIWMFCNNYHLPRGCIVFLGGKKKGNGLFKFKRDRLMFLGCVANWASALSTKAKRGKRASGAKQAITTPNHMRRNVRQSHTVSCVLGWMRPKLADASLRTSNRYLVSLSQLFGNELQKTHTKERRGGGGKLWPLTPAYWAAAQIFCRPAAWESCQWLKLAKNRWYNVLMKISHSQYGGWHI